MPRNIPIAIAESLASGCTTFCVLLKVTPVQPGYEPFGLTSLDVDIEYDDGKPGALLYSASVGTEPSTLRATGDMSVSGGESKQLMPVFDTPVSEQALAAGAYDYAKFVAYLIDYKNKENGHIILQTGTLGRNTITESGLAWTAELRGMTQVLKQTVTEKWSLTCRAIFGSQDPSAKSRYPCFYNADGLWLEGSVIDIADNTQRFTTFNVFPTFGGAPGLIEWLTGNNAGRSDETETFERVGPIDAIIGLTFGAAYPIQLGDTFRFRDDCPKTDIACKVRNNFQNFRGEPSIPVSDNGALSVGKIGGGVNSGEGG